MADMFTYTPRGKHMDFVNGFVIETCEEVTYCLFLKFLLPTYRFTDESY